jgi:hypothetical protein
MQGLYGPYYLSERVLQKIWLRQDFSTDALRTVSGRSLRIAFSGNWNHLGGPDFKDARFEIEGTGYCADVEIHFSPEDWIHHGHERNRAFNRVRLHVVLHGERGNPVAVRTEDGNCPEMLVLLPHLHQDLEAYAMDEALIEMERICEHPNLSEFSSLPERDRVSLLREQGEARWGQKVRFARKRLESVDWESACHQYCLEVLGYARNREPMSRLALRHPLSGFAGYSPEALFAEPDLNWRLDGLRPANHPRLRLQQYLNRVAGCPDWPVALKEMIARWMVPDWAGATRAFRQKSDLNRLLEDLRVRVLPEGLGATRCHTLMVDAFLPLAEAAGLLDSSALFYYWWHWPPGDCPAVVGRLLRQSGVCGSHRTFCNGLHQGAIGLFLGAGTTCLGWD